MTYMDRNHPDAHLDFPPLTKNEREEAIHPIEPGHVQCPKCKGYGGWNLRLNAYPLRGQKDTPENRHRYSHFQAGCNQCNGWGFVNKDDASCIHEWGNPINVGKCLNTYTCSKCGKKNTVDSSD